MLKEEGSSRQIIYISDFPKAPGCLCCCRILRRDLNSDFTPVSSKTSRTAVCPKKKEFFCKSFHPDPVLLVLLSPPPELLNLTSSEIIACSLYPSFPLDWDKKHYFQKCIWAGLADTFSTVPGPHDAHTHGSCTSCLFPHALVNWSSFLNRGSSSLNHSTV